MTETRGYGDKGKKEDYGGYPIDETMRYNSRMKGRIFRTIFGGNSSPVGRSRITIPQHYKKSEAEPKKSERKVESGLMRKLAAILSSGSFAASLFFLSGNITGNAVLNFEQAGANEFGILFILASLFFAILYLRKR